MARIAWNWWQKTLLSGVAGAIVLYFIAFYVLTGVFMQSVPNYWEPILLTGFVAGILIELIQIAVYKVW